MSTSEAARLIRSAIDWIDGDRRDEGDVRSAIADLTGALSALRVAPEASATPSNLYAAGNEVGGWDERRPDVTAHQERRKVASATPATPAAREECGSCRGYGHFDRYGKPSVDSRDRKCLDCRGDGYVDAEDVASATSDESDTLRELGTLGIPAVDIVVAPPSVREAGMAGDLACEHKRHIDRIVARRKVTVCADCGVHNPIAKWDHVAIPTPASAEGATGGVQTTKCEKCGDKATQWDYDQLIAVCARHVDQPEFTVLLEASAEGAEVLAAAAELARWYPDTQQAGVRFASIRAAVEKLARDLAATREKYRLQDEQIGRLEAQAIALLNERDEAQGANILNRNALRLRTEERDSLRAKLAVAEQGAVRGALAPVPEDILIADREGANHDPREVADFLDGMGDRADAATGEALHDAADVMRGLLARALLALPPAPAASPDGPCAFCGDPTDHLAGNPGLWPLHFAHPDGTGEVKAHHVKCVTERALPAVREVARVTARVIKVGHRTMVKWSDGISWGWMPEWPGAKVGDVLQVVVSAKEPGDG